jgi:predicted NUDIX family NTP pyrophosphohydrolase
VPLESLGEIRQPSGKIVTAYAAEADFDPATLRSNVFEMEWPPGSKRAQLFLEIDRAA